MAAEPPPVLRSAAAARWAADCQLVADPRRAAVEPEGGRECRFAGVSPVRVLTDAALDRAERPKTMTTPEPTRVEIALVKTARAVRRAFNEHLAAIDLTMSEGALLSYVDDRGAMTQRELADLLHVSRASAGSIIDGLHRKHLVSRSSDPSDKRVWLISLTADGLERVAEFRAVDDELRALLRRGFDRSERHQLAELLSRLEANAERSVSMIIAPTI